MAQPQVTDLQPSSQTIVPTIHPQPSTSSSDAITSHILSLLSEHKRSSHRPLMVLLQGPQGSGKTTVTRQLKSTLNAAPHHLRIAILSLDDLYLTHQGLLDVAAKFQNNAMLQGRGLPGTHDLKLGKDILRGLQFINDDETAHTVHLPIFDKSLFGGAGDRSSETVNVQGPLDIVIFEGWCCGFSPLTPSVLSRRYDHLLASNPPAVATRHPFESLLEIETNFQTLASTLYPFFTSLITIVPSSLSHIYSWRLEAEHGMKAANGGRGMTDDQVRAFVDRYMPVYELWGGLEGAMREPWVDRWKGRSLGIHVGGEREVLRIGRF